MKELNGSGNDSVKRCELQNNVKDLFKEYKWRGNIRELENTIYQAISLLEENETLIKTNHVQEISEAVFENVPDATRPSSGMKESIPTVTNMHDSNAVPRVNQEQFAEKLYQALVQVQDPKKLYIFTDYTRKLLDSHMTGLGPNQKMVIKFSENSAEAPVVIKYQCLKYNEAKDRFEYSAELSVNANITTEDGQQGSKRGGGRAYGVFTAGYINNMVSESYPNEFQCDARKYPLVKALAIEMQQKMGIKNDQIPYLLFDPINEKHAASLLNALELKQSKRIHEKWFK